MERGLPRWQRGVDWKVGWTEPINHIHHRLNNYQLSGAADMNRIHILILLCKQVTFVYLLSTLGAICWFFGYCVTCHKTQSLQNCTESLFLSNLFETSFVKCFGLCLAIIKEIMEPFVWFELCIIHALTLPGNTNSCGEIYGYFSICKHCCNCIVINICGFGKVCNSHGLDSQTRKSDCL
jgi:hypothetical protein